jgi:hypothetical protein
MSDVAGSVATAPEAPAQVAPSQDGGGANDGAGSIASAMNRALGAEDTFENEDAYLDDAIGSVDAAGARGERRAAGEVAELAEEEPEAGQDPNAAKAAEPEDDPEMDRAEAQLILEGYTRKDIAAMKRADPGLVKSTAQRLSGKGGAQTAAGKGAPANQPKAPLAERMASFGKAIRGYGSEFSPVADALDDFTGEFETARAEMTKQVEMTRQVLDRVYGQLEKEVLIPRIRERLSGEYGKIDDAAWSVVIAKAKQVMGTGKFDSLDEVLAAAASKALKPRQNQRDQTRGQMSGPGRRGTTKPTNKDPDDEYLDKVLRL